MIWHCEFYEKIKAIDFTSRQNHREGYNIAEYDDGVAILYPTGIYKAEHK